MWYVLCSVLCFICYVLHVTYCVLYVMGYMYVRMYVRIYGGCKHTMPQKLHLQVVETFVAAYVDVYFESDTAVVNDDMLQRFWTAAYHTLPDSTVCHSHRYVFHLFCRCHLVGSPTAWQARAGGRADHVNHGRNCGTYACRQCSRLSIGSNICSGQDSTWYGRNVNVHLVLCRWI